jgi:hypothetical protein
VTREPTTFTGSLGRFGIRWDERAREWNPESPRSDLAIDEEAVRPDTRHELRVWTLERRPYAGMPVLVECSLTPAPSVGTVLGMILVRPAGTGTWRVLKRDGSPPLPLDGGYFEGVAHVSFLFDRDHVSTRNDLVLSTPGRYEVKARALLRTEPGDPPGIDYRSVESSPIELEVLEPTTPVDRAALAALRTAGLFEGPSVPTHAHSAADLDAFLAEHSSSVYADYARFERSFYLNEPERFPELERLLSQSPSFGLRDRLAYELVQRAVWCCSAEPRNTALRAVAAERLEALERISHDSLWTARARLVVASLNHN